MAERIKKVAAIVLRPGPFGEEVLVFDHPTDDVGVMVQFPAGTIEPGESPENAVIRELKEETGVDGRLERRSKRTCKQPGKAGGDSEPSYQQPRPAQAF